MVFFKTPLASPLLTQKLPGILFLACVIIFLFETCSPAAPVNISGGPRFTFLTFERTGKLTATGGHLTGESQEEGVLGLALNINAGRWFFGSELYSGSASFESSTIDDPSRLLTGSVDITEINLALGFLVFREFGPFLAYTNHKQTTTGACPGCGDTFQFSRFGPGLSLNTPFPRTRWGGYARGSYLKGYNWEAGFSYSGIRLPLMGVVGFRQRIISYSPGEAACVEGASGCFRSRDKISGPVVSLYVIF